MASKHFSLNKLGNWPLVALVFFGVLIDGHNDKLVFWTCAFSILVIGIISLRVPKIDYKHLRFLLLLFFATLVGALSLGLTGDWHNARILFALLPIVLCLLQKVRLKPTVESGEDNEHLAGRDVEADCAP